MVRDSFKQRSQMLVSKTGREAVETQMPLAGGLKQQAGICKKVVDFALKCRKTKATRRWFDISWPSTGLVPRASTSATTDFSVAVVIWQACSSSGSSSSSGSAAEVALVVVITVASNIHALVKRQAGWQSFPAQPSGPAAQLAWVSATARRDTCCAFREAVLGRVASMPRKGPAVAFIHQRCGSQRASNPFFLLATCTPEQQQRGTISDAQGKVGRVSRKGGQGSMQQIRQGIILCDFFADGFTACLFIQARSAWGLPMLGPPTKSGLGCDQEANLQGTQQGAGGKTRAVPGVQTPSQVNVSRF